MRKMRGGRDKREELSVCAVSETGVRMTGPR